LRMKSSGSVRIRYAPSKERVEKILSKYFKNLANKLDLKIGILFGSYAKGNYSWGSDVDLLIVASNLPENQSKRFSILMDPDLPIQIEPFGYTTQEFKKMLDEKHPIVIEALSKGKILYASQDYRRLVEKYSLKIKEQA